MISSQRQHLILSRLRTRGAVRITALSKELGVSAMTIRRDIADLADKGLLKRVHGGAVTTSTLLSEPLFSVKSQMDIGLKDAIAQEAIKYVAPGDVIAIGGGTYVHDIPGGVAFGMEYPGWDYHMHGDDEFLPLEQLEENTRMMAAAILRICGA